jgi:hypothetical protein
MINLKRSNLILICSLLLLAFALAGIYFFILQPSIIRSKISRLQADFSSVQSPEPQQFDFLVFGHLYASQAVVDHLPARLITKHLPELLELHPRFIVSLGDMVSHRTRFDFINLQTHFLSRIDVPLFNTPGNHDVSVSDVLYREYLGSRSYPAQKIGSATLIFLDTERVSCSLDEDQKQTLHAELDAAVTDPQTKVIFVFMHKTLPFQDLEFRALNNRQVMPNEWKCQNKDGSNPIMDQYFIPAAKKKPVVLFAGDVGAWGNLSPYYQHDPSLPLALVMTGLGDTPQDNVIHVQVTPDSVQITAIFLNSMREVPIEKFDRDYWIKKAAKN